MDKKQLQDSKYPYFQPLSNQIKKLHSGFACIYFLIKNNEIIYIGKSENLPQRINKHSFTKDFTHYSFVECKPDDLVCLEAYFILRYKPIENKALPLNSGYISQINAKRKFKIYAKDFKIMTKKEIVWFFNGVSYFKINDEMRKAGMK